MGTGGSHGCHVCGKNAVNYGLCAECFETMDSHSQSNLRFWNYFLDFLIIVSVPGGIILAYLNNAETNNFSSVWGIPNQILYDLAILLVIIWAASMLLHYYLPKIIFTLNVKTTASPLTPKVGN